MNSAQQTKERAIAPHFIETGCAALSPLLLSFAKIRTKKGLFSN